MLRHCLLCVGFLLVDILVETLATAPTWNTPSSSTLTLDGTDFTSKCQTLTPVQALSGDGTPISYSVQSQTPDGGFTVVYDNIFGIYKLQCTASSITATSYTVVMRAIQDQGGNNEFTDFILTVSVPDITPVTGPTCSQSTSLTIDAGDSTSCDSVTTLSCASSDSTSVTYSIQSQSSSGVFALSGTTLTCTFASVVTGTTYTVDIRSQNTGNSGTTDTSFTIVAVTGPTCSQSTSLTIDAGDSTSCDSVTTLSCASSDSTSVTYSIQSQSSSGVFALSGTTLTCTFASIVDGTTYTVDIRARNTGNSGTTDTSFTIVASSNSESNLGSGGGGDNDNTGVIVGAVIGGCAGCALVAACAYIIYKAYTKKKTNDGNSLSPYENNEITCKENHAVDKDCNME